MLTAQQWATRWAAKMGEANDKIRQGVTALQTAPGEIATRAENENKMRTNWLASLASGKWHNNTVAVTLQSWQQSMIVKGLANMPAGIASGTPKVQAYATRAIPIMTALQAQIKAMPKANINDSKARMIAWIDGMVAAKPQLQRGPFG